MRPLILCLLLMALFFVLLCLGLLFAPYQLYSEAISRGVQSDFLAIKRPTKALLIPQLELAQLSSDREKKARALLHVSEAWKVLPFSNFHLPLPVRHPQYRLIPQVKFEGSRKQVLPGIKLVDFKGGEYLKIEILPKKRFILLSEDEILFSLPIFTAKIEQASISELWRDLFSKEIKERGMKFALRDLQAIFAAKVPSYHDLIYDLFILHLREKLFPNAKAIYFLKDSQMGVIVEGDSASSLNWRSLKIFSLERETIYGLSLVYREEHQEIKTVLDLLHLSMKFELTRPAIAKELYNEFRRLTFAEKKGQKGLSYLFSAWSHDVENKKLFSEMVSFLEKGEGNLIYLAPLYQFSHDMYRGILNEVEDNKPIKDFDNYTSPQSREISNEERMKIYLDRAKEAKRDAR